MKFRGEFWFLSNFYPCSVKIEIEGTQYEFDCAEAAFQACKCPSRATEFIRLNGKEARSLGRRVQLRSDWERVHVAFMYRVLQAKFYPGSYLLDKLILVKGDIVEENSWGDTFWGCCRGTGYNMLGRLLMGIRDIELKRRQSSE